MLLRKLCRAALLALCAALLLTGQLQRDPTETPDDPRLPNGKSQKEAILKADHEKSLDDAAELVQLTEELKIELEKSDRHVVSVGTVKKLEEIEKLAKRIRGRLKRH